MKSKFILIILLSTISSCSFVYLIRLSNNKINNNCILNEKDKYIVDSKSYIKYRNSYNSKQDLYQEKIIRNDIFYSMLNGYHIDMVWFQLDIKCELNNTIYKTPKINHLDIKFNKDSGYYFSIKYDFFDKFWATTLNEVKIETTNFSLNVNSYENFKGKYSNIYNIDLSNQNLTTIPEFIFKLPNLQYLDLSNNKLESLDDRIFRIKSLRYLDISYNEIRKIKIDRNESGINVIHASFNKLEKFEIDDNIDTNLQELYLRGNLIEKFEIHKGMKYIKVIDLGINQISGLMVHNNQEYDLIYLHLDSNLLNNFPKSLNSLKKIEYLDLGYNQMRNINVNLNEFKALNRLYLDNNILESFNLLEEISESVKIFILIHNNYLTLQDQEYIKKNLPNSTIHFKNGTYVYRSSEFYDD